MAKTNEESPDINRPRRVTLQDIADVMGVKKMVVSNALNGTGRVAPATKERVIQIARELNYIPNFAARALRTGKTGIIAILSGELVQPYYAHMVHLLEKQINSDGYSMVFTRSSAEVKGLVNATGKVAVDGAIAVDMPGLVNEFDEHSRIPCVSIGTFERSFVDNVIVDLSESVDEALRLMAAAGRKRIAYLVTAPMMERESEVRARTYLRAMERIGQKPEIINVMTDESEAVERKLKVHLLENGCPDALQCQNDETAMCALRVFKDLGYAVPKDVLLVGCDGQRVMRHLEPPLSTVAQPMEEMCASAWKFLKQRIADPTLPHQTVTYQGKLIITKSLVPIQRPKNPTL